MGDIPLVPERHVFQGGQGLPRTIRASPAIRSQVIGFFLCGMAEEPFWPLPNGSSTSQTSVRCRFRISVANCSSEEATTASVVKYSAWRSRCRT